MPVEGLARRVRENGAVPLVIHYDLEADTRVELSAKTFANWVDKTMNMIDDLGHDSGESIAVSLMGQRPDHWVSLVWVWAAWQFGSPVQIKTEDVQLVVTGPGNRSAEAELTVACSLHPLGLGFADELSEAVDYCEVLAQPDSHWSNPLPDWAIRVDRELGFEDLKTAPTPERLLLADPHDPLAVVRALISVLREGSLVLVRGSGPESWRRIANAERANLIMP